MAVGAPYLDPAEYEKYGLPEDTSSALVWEACLLVDKYTGHATSSTIKTNGVVNGLWRGEYKEIRRLPPERNKVRLLHTPAQSLVALEGLVSQSRRSEDPLYVPDVVMLIGSTDLNGIPQWQTIDETVARLEEDGTLWIPNHPYYGCGYSEVRVVYEAGYEVIPEDLKQAVAKLAASLPADEFEAQRRKAGFFAREVQEGDVRYSFFDTTLIPKAIADMLSNYKVRAYA